MKDQHNSKQYGCEPLHFLVIANIVYNLNAYFGLSADQACSSEVKACKRLTFNKGFNYFSYPHEKHPARFTRSIHL
jgi:hypothetical protein